MGLGSVLVGLIVTLLLFSVIYFGFLDSDTGAIFLADDAYRQQLENALAKEKKEFQVKENTELLDRFVSDINKMKGKKACFASYTPFPALQNKKIDISYSSGNTRIRFWDGKQSIAKQDLDIIPCVIGGSGSVTKNFDDIYLNNKDWKEKIKQINSNHYTIAGQITISEDDGGVSGLTENRINYGHGVVDFEDANYLYTPDGKHICFFPTVDGDDTCDGFQQEGLDDDCLGEADVSDTNSIPSQLAEGKLKRCS